MPGKYDVETVKSVAATLLRQAVRSEADAGEGTGIDAMGATPGAGMAPFGAYMRGGPLRTTTGGPGSDTERQRANSGAIISEPKADGSQIIAEIESSDNGRERVRPVANIWPSFQGGAQFIVNGGPEISESVGGYNPRVDHKPEHFHLRLNNGRTIRYLADTFEVHPYDKDKDTREHDKIIRRLTPDQREYLTKATYDIFKTGKISRATKAFLANKVIKRHPRVD